MKGTPHAAHGQTLNPVHTKLAYTVEEAADLLSLSRAQLYRLLDLKELASVKVGKCRRITAAQLDAYVWQLEQEHGFVRF